MSEKQTIEHHAPTPFKFGRTMDSEAIILAADNSYICHVQIHQTPRRCGEYDEPRRVANAKFIVSACNTVDSIKAKLARSEAACAEMRRVLEDCAVLLDKHIDDYTGTPIDVEIRDALSSDCGKGWHSPGEWAKLAEQREELRDICQAVLLLDSGNHPELSAVQDEIRSALATAQGKGEA